MQFRIIMEKFMYSKFSCFKKIEHTMWDSGNKKGVWARELHWVMRICIIDSLLFNKITIAVNVYLGLLAEYLAPNGMALNQPLFSNKMMHHHIWGCMVVVSPVDWKEWPNFMASSDFFLWGYVKNIEQKLKALLI